MSIHRSVQLSAALAVAAWALAAEAQPKDPVAAETLFREAREAAKKGDYAAACPKLAESQRLDPAAGTLFNLADCEERTGKLASAWQHYKQAAEQFPAGDERVAVANEHATKLEKRAPRLTLKLPAGAPAGTKVLRDGVELGAASLQIAIPVDPGKHRVVVRSASGKEEATEVTLAEGQNETVSLAVPAGDGGAGHAEGSVDKSSPQLGYIVAGVGAVSLVVSGVTGFMVMGKKSTFDSECDAGKNCSQKGLDAADSGKSLSKISTVTFLLGAAGVGVGTYLIVSRKGQETTAVVPAVSPSGGGLQVVRSF